MLLPIKLRDNCQENYEEAKEAYEKALAAMKDAESALEAAKKATEEQKGETEETEKLLSIAEEALKTADESLKEVQNELKAKQPYLSQLEELQNEIDNLKYNTQAYWKKTLELNNLIIANELYAGQTIDITWHHADKDWDTENYCKVIDENGNVKFYNYHSNGENGIIEIYEKQQVADVQIGDLITEAWTEEVTEEVTYYEEYYKNSSGDYKIYRDKAGLPYIKAGVVWISLLDYRKIYDKEFTKIIKKEIEHEAVYATDTTYSWA